MAQRCGSTGDSIRSGMNQLVGQIQALSGGGMAGQANNALQDVSAQLNDGLSKIMAALDELGGKMTDAAGRYTINDEDAAADIRNAPGASTDSSVVNALRG